MAFSPSVDWDGDFKEDPKGTGLRSLGDDKFRDTKVAFRERVERSHSMDVGVDNANHGIHLTGSGRAGYDSGDPTENAAGELMGSIDGYIYVKTQNIETQDTDESRLRVMNEYAGSAWAGIEHEAPSDIGDIIPASHHFISSGGDLHGSTLINWVQSFLGGDYHGYVSCTGVILSEQVTGITYVDSDILYYISASSPSASIERSDATSEDGALLMLNRR